MNQMFPVCVCVIRAVSGRVFERAGFVSSSCLMFISSSELEMNIRGFISLFLLINLIRKISSSVQKNPETFRFQLSGDRFAFES